MEDAVRLFVAHVVYVQPSSEELERRFPYRNKYSDVAGFRSESEGEASSPPSRFDPIERCKQVSKESREIVFEYIHTGRCTSTDKVLARMGRSGLRPALYEELLSFAEKYPDEQLKYPIAALGSETVAYGDCRYIACLSSDEHGRYLTWDQVGSKWSGRARFLAVRE